MTAPTLPAAGSETRDYLAAVDRELADLPADERSALLEDLAMHLEALSAEPDDRPVAVRLGAPGAYAAELRAAAGLPARSGAAARPRHALRDQLDRLRTTSAGREVEQLVRELRPAWWVLRGYLLVVVLCLVGPEWDAVPVPAPLDNRVLGLLLVLAAVVLSVRLGRQATPRPLGRVLAVGAGVVAALGMLVVLLGISLTGSSSSYAPAPYAEQALGAYPLLSRSGPVTDVLPYAADGTPLEGVLLYDQDGRPLQVGFQEWWADGCPRVLQQPRAADGVPVPHSFPQGYVLDPAVPTAGCTEDVVRPEVAVPVLPVPAPEPATAPAADPAAVPPAAVTPPATDPAAGG